MPEEDTLRLRVPEAQGELLPESGAEGLSMERVAHAEGRAEGEPEPLRVAHVEAEAQGLALRLRLPEAVKDAEPQGQGVAVWLAERHRVPVPLPEREPELLTEGVRVAHEEGEGERVPVPQALTLLLHEALPEKDAVGDEDAQYEALSEVEGESCEGVGAPEGEDVRDALAQPLPEGLDVSDGEKEGDAEAKGEEEAEGEDALLKDAADAEGEPLAAGEGEAERESTEAVAQGVEERLRVALPPVEEAHMEAERESTPLREPEGEDVSERDPVAQGDAEGVGVSQDEGDREALVEA